MYLRTSRPQGENTRGKTAKNRLRRLDLHLVRHERALLARSGGPWDVATFVDVGFGRLPWTTVEAATRLRAVRPELPVWGVEIDPERVDAAQEYAEEGVRFARGGFELAGIDAPARLVRAMNVLRQYDASEVPRAWTLMGKRLLPGGLLVEGTCDPFGRLLTAALLRRVGDRLSLEGLLFSAGMRADFEPAGFKAVLPKAWIHRVVPGEPVFEFFERWSACWSAARPASTFGVRQQFLQAAEELGKQLPAARTPRSMLKAGAVLWRPEERFDLALR